jgi:hypothetical protein
VLLLQLRAANLGDGAGDDEGGGPSGGMGMSMGATASEQLLRLEARVRELEDARATAMLGQSEAIRQRNEAESERNVMADRLEATAAELVRAQLAAERTERRLAAAGLGPGTAGEACLSASTTGVGAYAAVPPAAADDDDFISVGSAGAFFAAAGVTGGATATAALAFASTGAMGPATSKAAGIPSGSAAPVSSATAAGSAAAGPATVTSAMAAGITIQAPAAPGPLLRAAVGANTTAVVPASAMRRPSIYASKPSAAAADMLARKVVGVGASTASAVAKHAVAGHSLALAQSQHHGM